MQCSNVQNKLGFITNNKLSFLMISSLILLLLLSNAFAGASLTEDPLGDRLCAILKVMMGPTAKAIATIAIIFVAIGLFAGRMTWLTVIPIILGIIIIFSAPTLVKFIGGANASDCQATSG